MSLLPIIFQANTQRHSFHMPSCTQAFTARSPSHPVTILNTLSLLSIFHTLTVLFTVKKTSSYMYTTYFTNILSHRLSRRVSVTQSGQLMPTRLYKDSLQAPNSAPSRAKACHSSSTPGRSISPPSRPQPWQALSSIFSSMERIVFLSFSLERETAQPPAGSP